MEGMGVRSKMSWRLFAFAAAVLACLCGAVRADDAQWRGVEQEADRDPRATIQRAEAALKQAQDRVAELQALRTIVLARGIAGEEAGVAEYIERGLALARSLADTDSEAWLLSQRAWTLEGQGKHQAATASIDEAMALAKRSGLKRTLAVIHWVHGNMLAQTNHYPLAQRSFDTSYALFESQQDRHGMALALSAIAKIALRHSAGAQERDQAIEQWSKALALIDPQVHRSSAALFTYDIGLAQATAGRLQPALDAFSQSLALSRAIDNAYGIVLNQIEMAKVLLKQQRHAEALARLDAVQHGPQVDQSPRLQHAVLVEQAEAQAHLGRRRESLESLARAETLLPRIRQPTAVARHHDSAANVHALFGEFEPAYRHRQREQQALAAYNEANNKRQLDELRVRFDVKLKDAENALLREREAESATRRTLLAVVLALTLLLSAAIVFVLRRRTVEANARAAHQAALAAAESRAHQAKSAFLANMSHELRSPLNAMLGFARLLSRDASLAPRAREDLGVVLRSGEHLYGLINQVLEISKIEAGHVSAVAVDFDLHALLEELAELYSVNAQAKGLTLQLSIAAGTPRHVSADVVKVRQVLGNLLSNAIKFTSEGGVTLAARALDADRVQFTVTDTGTGIAAEDLPRLGAPFVQADAGRRSAEGTGLGLAICRGFAHTMGGELTLDSTLGEGTRAIFTLPMPEVEAVQVEPAILPRRVRALAPDQPRLRILAVDDREEGRRLLSRLLAPMGFEVTEAGDGEQAVRAWRDGSPHLILMDMRMPVMDGLQATRLIKAEAHSRQVAAPVIVALTASSFEEQRREILAAGCDDFLRKPFQEAALFEMLGRHLGVRFLQDEPDAVVDTPAAEPPTARSLPSDLRQALAQALGTLDVERIELVIDDIEAHDPAVAAVLRPMARDFAHARIARWLKESE
jgi:signal transduction histidine kinase/DNA-binding response OmpR family regulator